MNILIYINYNLLLLGKPLRPFRHLFGRLSGSTKTSESLPALVIFLHLDQWSRDSESDDKVSLQVHLTYRLARSVILLESRALSAELTAPNRLARVRALSWGVLRLNLGKIIRLVISQHTVSRVPPVCYS